VDVSFRANKLYAHGMEQQIEHHKAWRLQYREERYLRVKY